MKYMATPQLRQTPWLSAPRASEPWDVRELMCRGTTSVTAARCVQALVTALLLAVAPLAALSAEQERLAVLLGDGGLLLHSPQGEALLSINSKRALVPASLLKIPLSHVALTTLGEDYRFETRFYRNDGGDLLIRGLGDPFLVSEEVARIADALAVQGLTEVRRLVVDDSAFEPEPDLPLERGSSQPYGARNSALAVNFNTVNLAWTADGRLVSGEPQTPLTPLARELGLRLTAGEPQRINLGADPEAGLRQVQQLFAFFLEESGIPVLNTNYYRDKLDATWSPYYRHLNTRTLRDTLEGLLRYSNNFIANQLFMILATHQGGYPATATTARAHLQQRLAELYGADYGSDPEVFLMLEGSGLDRAQRSSADAMVHILESFRPHADLLPEVGGVLRKSGTLTGVYNYAGYIKGEDGLYPYVLLTNQMVNNRDEILRLLRQQVTARR